MCRGIELIVSMSATIYYRVGQRGRRQLAMVVAIAPGWVTVMWSILVGHKTMHDDENLIHNFKVS